MIFGSYDSDGTSEFNAAFFLAPHAGAARPFAVYRKARLFPLTERVPAFLDSPRLRRALPVARHLGRRRGDERRAGRTARTARRCRWLRSFATTFSTPRSRARPCRDGADLIVTLSNDSWFAFGPGPELHLQGAVFRSIETRRPQVRATNTGISAVIDATGDVVARAGVDERATLVAAVVPERRTTTLVVRFGEWLNPCALLMTIALVAWARFARARNA